MLRDYQENLVRRSLSSPDSKNCIALPTGGGKSKVMSALIRHYIDQGMRIRFMSHRKFLILQIAEHLREMGIYDLGYLMPQQPFRPNLPVQLASVRSLARKPNLRTPADVVFWEECHHILSNEWQSAGSNDIYNIQLGFTATPIHMGAHFDRLIEGPQVLELIKQGYQPQYEFYNARPPELDGVRTTGGDYNLRQLSRKMRQPHLIEELAMTWLERCSSPLRPTLIFAVDIEHSQMIVDRYRKAGIRAAHIDGTMGFEEQKAILRRLGDGTIDVISNVALFDEGFDMATFCKIARIPVRSLEALQMARPTKSLRVYSQQSGRILRKTESGRPVLYLDHAGNSFRFGFPSDPRNWADYWMPKPKKTQLPRGEAGDRAPSVEPIEQQQKLYRQDNSPIGRLHLWLQQPGAMPLLLVDRFLKTHPTIDELIEGSKLLGYNNPSWIVDSYCQYANPDNLGRDDERAIARKLKIPVAELRELLNKKILV